MCLNELDLSVFLSDQTPVPHDVVFLVEDDFDKTNNTTLMAHRLFLAAVSPVFQKSFYGTLGVAENPVRIQDSTPTAFKTLLDYIYLPESSISVLQHHNLDDVDTILTIFELLKLADMYLMEKLRKQCESALVSGVMINRDNIFDLARLASNFSCFQHASETIMDKCARYLKLEIPKNISILKEFGKEDYEVFQMLISHGDKLKLPVEEIAADEILTASGIFPLDEIPTEHLDISDLPLESTARQTGIINCLTRFSDIPRDLTCFSAYDRYCRPVTDGGEEPEEDHLVVGEVFKKYMLKNNEPFLFYCNIPPYTKRMFGGSPDSTGFLDIQWADIVYILVLRGSVSCVIASNLVRMTEGDILRFDTLNTSGIWNLSPRSSEIIVVAHE